MLTPGENRRRLGGKLNLELSEYEFVGIERHWPDATCPEARWL